MRVRIELQPGETPEQADELLSKAAQAKHECTGSERYAEPWLNELEAHVKGEHRRLLDSLGEGIADEVARAV